MTRAVPATIEHARALAPELRQDDVEECLAAGYRSALEALEAGVRESLEAWALFVDGKLAAIFGIGIEEDLAGVVLVWVLTGRAVEGAKKAFFRASQLVVAHWRRQYRGLFNLVDARYTRAIRWLEALGFKVLPEAPHPTTGKPFRLAVIGGV